MIYSSCLLSCLFYIWHTLMETYVVWLHFVLSWMGFQSVARCQIQRVPIVLKKIGSPRREQGCSFERLCSKQKMRTSYKHTFFWNCFVNFFWIILSQKHRLSDITFAWLCTKVLWWVDHKWGLLAGIYSSSLGTI